MKAEVVVKWVLDILLIECTSYSVIVSVYPELKGWVEALKCLGGAAVGYFIFHITRPYVTKFFSRLNEKIGNRCSVWLERCYYWLGNIWDFPVRPFLGLTVTFFVVISLGYHLYLTNFTEFFDWSVHLWILGASVVLAVIIVVFSDKIEGWVSKREQLKRDNSRK